MPNTARIVSLADALKTAINAAEIPGAVPAKRVYKPNYDTTKTKALQINVVIGSDRSREAADRESWTDPVTIHVAIYKKINVGDGTTEDSNPEVDAVLFVAEKIYDVFAPGQQVGAYNLKAVDNTPTFVPEWIRENSCVVSIIAFSFDIP